MPIAVPLNVMTVMHWSGVGLNHGRFIFWHLVVFIHMPVALRSMPINILMGILDVLNVIRGRVDGCLVRFPAHLVSV